MYIGGLQMLVDDHDDDDNNDEWCINRSLIFELAKAIPGSRVIDPEISGSIDELQSWNLGIVKMPMDWQPQPYSRELLGSLLLAEKFTAAATGNFGWFDLLGKYQLSSDGQLTKKLIKL